MIKAILFFTIITQSLLCLSGTIDPNVSDNKYIEYGSKFNYILKLDGYNNDNELMSASCVAINNEWVLTAAHVVKPMEICYIVYNDNNINIDKIIIHKDFCVERFGIADIAMCHLTQNINLDFYPDLYSDIDELNKICSISGFGATGTFDTGSKLIDGKRRSGSNIIDEIQEDLLVCSPSKDHKKTSLEFLIAHGDSGGGLFIGNKLAGINSCVMTIDKKPNSSYGDESGHTRISKYIPWIKENINGYSKP